MESLLIDYNRIVKPDGLDLLKGKLSSAPTTKHDVGLCLVVPSSQLEILHSQPKGEQRVKHINTHAFVNDIKDHAYFLYNKKAKTCDILEVDDKSLRVVLESIMLHIPNDVTLYKTISLDESNVGTIKMYVNEGFAHPYVCQTPHLNSDDGDTFGLRVSKLNDMGSENVNNQSIINEIKHVIRQVLLEHGHHEMRFRVGKESVAQLENACNAGSTFNSDGTVTQKEIAGTMVVKKVDDNLIYELEIDQGSVIFGKEEEVDIVKGLYGFHSHPKSAYKRHNVKLGWPSSNDYIGFLQSSQKHDAILHMVVCLEGVYVISLSQYWVNNKEELKRAATNFITDNYGFCYERGNTIEWYTDKVNKRILYKGSPIFDVKFRSWKDMNGGATSNVCYDRKVVNCVTIGQGRK
jgi:hypothetical protein